MSASNAPSDVATEAATTIALLLCDDDALRLATLSALRALAVEVRVVFSIEEARNVADSAALVVAAGATGTALCEELSRVHHRAPRVLLAEASSTPDASSSISLWNRTRPFAVVPLPIDEAVLQAAIVEALAPRFVDDPPTKQVRVPPPAAPFERLTVDRETGALSTAYLRFRLFEESLRARRYARPLALGLFDVDDLRQISDDHGDQMVASLLRHVAEVLVRGARTVDLVGRWAAGSFAVLLPETPGAPAWAICDRLRGQVAASTFPSSSHPIALHLSVGVAMQPRGARDAGELVDRADTALWRAKRAGGARTVGDGSS